MKVTPEKKTKFLAELAANGANVTRAAEATAISRGEWYRVRHEEPAFARAWAEALELGTDALEDEAVRRGADGTLRPVFHQGAECGQLREYSDTLLIFMLKARRPEKFKDRLATEHSGKIAHQLAADWSRLDQDDRRRLLDLFDKAGATPE